MADTGYTITPSPLVLDNNERKYVLTVHDLPNEERPRERLIAEGPASLSTTELMAVLLNVGTTKEDVLSMARRIMQDYGERGVMSQTDAERLSQDLDIPLGKAAQIIAAGELGRRFFERNGNGAPTIRTAREVYEYVADMRTLPKECLRGLYLNAHYKVIHDEVISLGTVDANIVHPREVFRPALEYSAAAVILVHNHPSGVVDPSAADLTVTEQLVAAGTQLGIPLVDHVIVAERRVFERLHSLPRMTERVYALSPIFFTFRDAEDDKRVKRLEFHLKHGDYFPMLATIFGFLEETAKHCDPSGHEYKLIQNVRKDLMHLHTHYRISPKDR